jgi:hypothetical protein
MKKIFTCLAAAMVLLVPLACWAQYPYYGYGSYYPQGYSPPPVYQQPAPPYAYPQPGPPGQAVAPPTALYQRWQPDPSLWRRWDQHNRMSDFFEIQRSPLNRESDLDYMLRTF